MAPKRAARPLLSRIMRKGAASENANALESGAPHPGRRELVGLELACEVTRCASAYTWRRKASSVLCTCKVPL